MPRTWYRKQKNDKIKLLCLISRRLLKFPGLGKGKKLVRRRKDPSRWEKTSTRESNAREKLPPLEVIQTWKSRNV
jgi:hypothetical protein